MTLPGRVTVLCLLRQPSFGALTAEPPPVGLSYQRRAELVTLIGRAARYCWRFSESHLLIFSGCGQDRGQIVAEQTAERWAKITSGNAVVHDPQLFKSCLEQLALGLRLGSQVSRRATAGQQQGVIHSFFDVGGICFVFLDHRPGLDQLSLDTLLLPLECHQRQGVRQVRLGELLLFVLQLGRPPLLDGDVFAATGATLSKPGQDCLADIVRLRLGKANGASPVFGGGLLRVLDSHERLRAAVLVSLPAEAEEVRVLHAGPAAGEGDSHSASAVPAVQAALEIVRTLLRLLAGDATGGEYRLDCFKRVFVNERLVTTGIDQALVCHYAEVVAVAQHVLHCAAA